MNGFTGLVFDVWDSTVDVPAVRSYRPTAVRGGVRIPLFVAAAVCRLALTSDLDVVHTSVDFS